MSRTTISVFEHERLVLGETRETREGGRLKLTQAHFDALVRFNERSDRRYISIGYRQIRFRHYVGFLQIGEFGIEVLPKIDSLSEDRTPYREALLDMLRMTGGLRIQNPSEASLAARRGTLLDLYIVSFLDLCDGLLREGLTRGYRRVQANQPVFRGRLVTTQHLRHNLVRADRVYTEHQVYDHEIVVNQALVSALGELDRLPLAHGLRTRVQRCRAALPESLGGLPSLAALDRVVLGRNTSRYRHALEFVRLILTHRAPTLRTGRLPVLAVLLDMNQLWERYVLALLRAVAPEGIRVDGQSSRAFWRPDSPGERSRKVRPDIVVHDGRGGDVLAILDTKWKIPKGGRAAIGDLGQMFIYNELFACPHAVLVYPGHGVTTVRQSGRFESAVHRCSTVCLSLLRPGTFSRSFARERAREFLDRLLPKA